MVRFHSLPCMLLILLLMNPEIISFLRFWLFMLFHDDKIRSFIVTGGFLVLFNSEAHLLPCSMYAPDFTVSESRSYFIVEVLSLFTLFHEDKNLLLMVPYPSLLEFIHLRWSAFTRYHVCSWFHITNLEVTSFLRLCLFLYCFMLTKSILWCLLIRRFWNSPICEGQLSLDTIYDPDATFDESRSYFIVEICLFLIASWWQSPFFDGCWPIAFGLLSFAKVSFRLLACVLRISMGTNLEVTSSLSFCLFLHFFRVAKSFLWWLLTHRFPSSVFCEV